MLITITGTPGTGKTTIAKKLSDVTGLEYVSINELARDNDCITGKDEIRNSDIIDIECLKKVINELNNCILDGHVAHMFDVDKVYVLRTEPKVLEARLFQKGWSKAKVNENVEAELLGIIASEAREENDNVNEINTTEIEPDTVVEIIEEDLNSEQTPNRIKDVIDWM